MMSHLLQMRGLKLFQGAAYAKTLVASFTDAWIETDLERIILDKDEVASFTDAWIETFKGNIVCCFIIVASFTDAWIETRH